MSVAELARAGRATELAGVGATLQEKILALIDTGTIPAAEKLRAKIPAGLIAITRLPGLGPKRARLLHSELGIDSLDALREAALAQRLRTVRGLGAKFETSVLEALEKLGENPAVRAAPRLLLPKALELGEALAAGLRERGGDGTRCADRRLGATDGRQREGHRPDRGHAQTGDARQEPRHARRRSRASPRPAGRAQGHAPTRA